MTEEKRSGGATAELLALTSQIVAAHVGNNVVPMADLPIPSLDLEDIPGIADLVLSAAVPWTGEPIR